MKMVMAEESRREMATMKENLWYTAENEAKEENYGSWRK
jgi:hypothetical protein